MGSMGRYYRDGDPKDASNLYAYITAQTMVQILKQCGNDLTRENVMKQAANIKNLKLPLLLPLLSLAPPRCPCSRRTASVASCWRTGGSGSAPMWWVCRWFPRPSPRRATAPTGTRPR